MFLESLLVLSGLLSTICAEGQTPKPYVFPIPFELPSRNEKANQCWLRIEDVELIETLAIYCFLANEFLRSYAHDYNSRKMLEDDVDVYPWDKEPNAQVELMKPIETVNSNGKKIKDWNMTTVLDPTTHIRIYITQKAECSIIMNSRQATMNYRVECPRILYFINHRMYGSATLPCVKDTLIVASYLVILVLNLF